VLTLDVGNNFLSIRKNAFEKQPLISSATLPIQDAFENSDELNVKL
jgi:hypothetical protein